MQGMASHNRSMSPRSNVLQNSACFAKCPKNNSAFTTKHCASTQHWGFFSFSDVFPSHHTQPTFSSLLSTIVCQKFVQLTSERGREWSVERTGESTVTSFSTSPPKSLEDGREDFSGSFHFPEQFCWQFFAPQCSLFSWITIVTDFQ